MILRSSSCSRVVSPDGEPDPLGLPLGFGLSASGPSSLYAFSHFLKGLGEAIPNYSMASGFVMPSSTTALTAASFVSNE